MKTSDAALWDYLFIAAALALTAPTDAPVDAGRDLHALRTWSLINSPFGSSALGALRRCKTLVWLATRRVLRLALPPKSDGQMRNLFSTMSLAHCSASDLCQFSQVMKRCLTLETSAKALKPVNIRPSEPVFVLTRRSRRPCARRCRACRCRADKKRSRHCQPYQLSPLRCSKNAQATR